MTRNPFVEWVLTHVFAGPGARRRGSRPTLPDSLRLFIGLGVPFVAVVPTIPLLSRLDWVVFGVPAEVAWLFCCIPLTSACLALCWFAYDRHEDGG